MKKHEKEADFVLILRRFANKTVEADAVKNWANDKFNVKRCRKGPFHFDGDKVVGHGRQIDRKRGRAATRLEGNEKQVLFFTFEEKPRGSRC